ncbi:MAG: sugar diacid recognition domain-containing protein [Oscillospiraceae bacterium]|nr:sugar diacid recognition domain-containing protein [Oscillospiraceae bacterium]
MKISRETARSIVAEISSAIGKNVNLMDAAGCIIASTNPSRIGTFHSGAKKIIAEKLDHLDVFTDQEYSGAMMGVNVPITFEGDIIGVIGITGEWNEVGKYGQIIKKITEILIFDSYVKEQKILNEGLVSRFIESWLFEDSQSLGVNFAERGVSLGIDVSLPRRVAVLGLHSSCGIDDERSSQELLSQAEQLVRQAFAFAGQCLCYRASSKLVLLLPDLSRHQIQQSLEWVREQASLHHGLDLAVGVDEKSRSGPVLRSSYQKACKALNAALAARGYSRTVFYDDINMEIFLSELPQELKAEYIRKIFRGFSPGEIREVIGLLTVFYDCDGSLAQTAERLFIHKNTLQYHLRKLSERTGLDPRRLSNASLYQMAILFWPDAQKII